MNLSLLTLMALQYLNAPYTWGANGPFEFDCSGLVLKCLHDVGVTLPDMTAHSLYKYYLNKSNQSVEPSQDCLLFFGNAHKIKHVAIAISDTHMIEAGGAGSDSTTMSLADKGRIDARVRIKPITNRSDLHDCLKIKY